MLTRLTDLCVYCSEIPDTGLEFELKEDFKDLDIKADDFNIKEPVHIKGKIKKFGQDVYVQGHLFVKMITACSRCLEEFAYTLDTEFEATYAPMQDELLEEEKELEQTDLDTLFYENDRIDLKEAIREQIVLSVPLKMLCKSDCLGLCSRCGENLNVAKCGCSADDIDPRLEGLKKLKTDS